MDRFIVDTIADIITDVADLKSNMDRFIELQCQSLNYIQKI